jgi:hypothetical protein
LSGNLEVGFILPDQTKQIGSLTVVHTCGFDDHMQEQKLVGSIVDFHGGRSIGTAEKRRLSAGVPTLVFVDTLH